MRRVGPHRVPVRRLGLADPGLAPRVGDAAGVTDEVEDPQVEAADPAQGEELGGRLARVDDHLGAGHVGDGPVEPVVDVEVLVELAVVRRRPATPVAIRGTWRCRTTRGCRCAIRAVTETSPRTPARRRRSRTRRRRTAHRSRTLVLGRHPGEDRVELTGVDRARHGTEHAFEQGAARSATPAMYSTFTGPPHHPSPSTPSSRTG